MRMVSRVPAVFAAALIVAARPSAADDLANGAFRIQYDKGGLTSIRRTADVADTDYIAQNGSLGRLVIRYRAAPNGEWKELRELVPAGVGVINGAVKYHAGESLPALRARS